MTTQDHQLTRMISITLRGGIMMAVACAIVGSLLYLPSLGATPAAFHKFQGNGIPFASLPGIAAMVRSKAMPQRGLGIAELGVLVLMMTPLLRVIFSLFSFLRSGDRLFSTITLVVLAALACRILLH